MKMGRFENKLLNTALAAGLALSLSACSTAPLRNPYGPNLSDSDRVTSMQTYQKNLTRNYMETVDNVANGKEVDFTGKTGVVRQMQNERMKDYATTAGMFVVNGAIVYAIIPTSSSSSSSGNGTTPVDPGQGTMAPGGSNSNYIFDSVGSGWRP